MSTVEGGHPSLGFYEVSILARVLFDYEAQESGEITIKKGDFVMIKMTSRFEDGDLDWAYGYVLNRDSQIVGNFPKKNIEKVDLARTGLGTAPDETVINITDTDFVPEGFHENCRDQNGSIKITDQNRHLYQDINHLIRIHEKEGWGQTPGTLYTKEMTGCPDGRLPTIEVIMSLQLSGYKLHGRIIMTKNNVFDADTQNKMATLTQEDIPILMEDFQKKNEWEKRWEPMPAKISISKTIDQRVGDGSHMKISSGEYKLKTTTFRKSEEGISKFCVCDEPTCCLMSMTLLGVCATGMLDPDSKRQMMKYFKERVMYQNNDEVNGNTEICHYCLNQAS